MKRNTVIIIAIVITLFLGAAAYLKAQQSDTKPPIPISSQTPKQANSTPVQSNSPESTKPSITTPQPNTKVVSPLMVKGSVPPGWMFEGVFEVKLLDENRKVIVKSQAKEVTPGSWSSGKDIEFSASLNFSTTSPSGFLVLEKDNPSGLPENSDSFEIPIRFN